MDSRGLAAIDNRRLYVGLNKSSQAELDPVWWRLTMGILSRPSFPSSPAGSSRAWATTNLSNLPVSPNPSTGVIWVRRKGSAKEPQRIVVRDIAGRVRTEVSLNPASADRGRTMLDLRRLPAGVYFLETAGERRNCKLVLVRPGGAP